VKNRCCVRVGREDFLAFGLRGNLKGESVGVDSL